MSPCVALYRPVLLCTALYRPVLQGLTYAVQPGQSVQQVQAAPLLLLDGRLVQANVQVGPACAAG